jgi:hypothetical protein
MLEPCQNCGGLVIFARPSPTGVFCSSACRQHHKTPDFCEACLEQTHEVGAGNTCRVNGVGTALYGRGTPCPRCGSVIQQLFWCLLFIPIIPLGRFRVKYCAPGKYISRRLRTADEPYVSLASVAAEDQGYKLLAEATRFEIQGRVQEALATYQKVFDNYPSTSAGRDARRSAETLRATIA